ncbi:MAG: amidohydrolase family protein [Erythrobacter sp.]
MSDRRTGAITALCLAAWSLGACQTVAPAPARQQADLVLAGGKVYDGTLADAQTADVVVSGGRIVEVGHHAARLYEAKQRIDVAGLVVAPGFIDPHTHADEELGSDDATDRANLPWAFQGVTTVVVGNDGFGTPHIAGLAATASERGIGTNVAYLAGFGPIREAVLGTKNRAPDEAELATMRKLTRKAMCEGAWGLSAGLYYVPQNYAATAEVVEMAKVAGAMGGYYDTHMRDESTYNITVTGAVSETLEIGREASIPVHISHIKALGPDVWGQSGPMIAMIEDARQNGQRVTADQYPWSASGTRISNALVPHWALEGGLDALRGRLAHPAEGKRVRDGMVEGLARRGGADKLLVTGVLGGVEVPVGQTLAQIADAMRLSPVEAAIAILMQGDARVASFNMSDQDIAAFAHRDWVVTGSDGSSGHPRKYASFPKAYRDLVVDGTMPLVRFIRRSSAQTAEIVGLTDRGYLKPGYAADIVVFDPATYAPRASYQEPEELSAGVRYLFVNGEALISEGENTGVLSGRPLLKETSC